MPTPARQLLQVQRASPLMNRWKRRYPTQRGTSPARRIRRKRTFGAVVRRNPQVHATAGQSLDCARSVPATPPLDRFESRRQPERQTEDAASRPAKPRIRQSQKPRNVIAAPCEPVTVQHRWRLTEEVLVPAQYRGLEEASDDRYAPTGNRGLHAEPGNNPALIRSGAQSRSRGPVSGFVAQRRILCPRNGGAADGPGFVHGIENPQVAFRRHGNRQVAVRVRHERGALRFHAGIVRQHTYPRGRIRSPKVADTGGPESEPVEDSSRGRLDFPLVDDARHTGSNADSGPNLDALARQILLVRVPYRLSRVLDDVARQKHLMSRFRVGMDDGRRQTLEPLQLRTVGDAASLPSAVRGHKGAEEP